MTVHEITMLASAAEKLQSYIVAEVKKSPIDSPQRMELEPIWNAANFVREFANSLMRVEVKTSAKV